jgi:hypothetical protein
MPARIVGKVCDQRYARCLYCDKSQLVPERLSSFVSNARLTVLDVLCTHPAMDITQTYGINWL